MLIYSNKVLNFKYMYISKNTWFPSTINQIAEYPTTICIMRRLLCIVLQHQNSA